MEFLRASKAPKKKSLDPNFDLRPHCFYHALRSATELIDGEEAEKILQDAEELCLGPTAKMIAAVVNICRLNGDWTRALRLVELMHRKSGGTFLVQDNEPQANRQRAQVRFLEHSDKLDESAADTETDEEGPVEAPRGHQGTNFIGPLSLALRLLGDAAIQDLERVRQRVDHELSTTSLSHLMESQDDEADNSREGDSTALTERKRTRVNRLRPCRGVAIEALKMEVEHPRSPWAAVEAVLGCMAEAQIYPSHITAAIIVQAAPDFSHAQSIFEYYVRCQGIFRSKELILGAMVAKTGEEALHAPDADDQRLEAAAWRAWSKLHELVDRFPDENPRYMMVEVLSLLAKLDRNCRIQGEGRSWGPTREEDITEIRRQEVGSLGFRRDDRPAALDAGLIWAATNGLFPPFVKSRSRKGSRRRKEGPCVDLHQYPPDAAHIPLYLILAILVRQMRSEAGLPSLEPERIADRCSTLEETWLGSKGEGTAESVLLRTLKGKNLLIWVGRPSRLSSGPSGRMHESKASNRLKVVADFLSDPEPRPSAGQRRPIRLSKTGKNDIWSIEWREMHAYLEQFLPPNCAKEDREESQMMQSAS
eukprot:scaffold1804_cov263-Pinguiococcus_pyrenoidosus.AAC.14